jgi:hypothetical protein
MNAPEDWLRKWLRRVSMRQLYTELDARLPRDAYQLELEGDTLTVFGLERKRRFLGLWTRTVRRPLLRVTCQNQALELGAESSDPTFVARLVEMLRTG